METQTHERFAIANRELSEFLQRVDGVASGKESITESDLQSLSQRLQTLDPEVGDASRGATLDQFLQNEIDKYVKSLRALQTALEKVRCMMLTRKFQLEGSKGHLHGVQARINAYHQITRLPPAKPLLASPQFLVGSERQCLANCDSDFFCGQRRIRQIAELHHGEQVQVFRFQQFG